MTVLVDTVIWVDYWAGRANARPLVQLLTDDQVATHSAIRGELALGDHGQRSGRLEALESLPHLATVDDDEARALIAREKLAGTGIGWVDTHLVAAALAGGAKLWTRDRSLGAVAVRLKIGWAPTGPS